MIRKISIHRSPPTPPALPPILFRLALHRRRRQVLHLEPIGRGPERYIESLRFETMPSSPILQAWAKPVVCQI